MTRIGICGTGRLAGVHSRHLQRIPGIELIGFDRNPEAAAAFGEQFKCETTSDFDTLAEDCDGILVVTPNDAHVEYALRTLEAGKAVFVEKPIAGTPDEGQKVADLAEKLNGTVMVGHVVRYFPEFRRAAQILKDGEIGKPASIRMRRGGSAPAGKGNWFMDHHRSGGVFIDLAVHDFDWLLANIGPVKRLYAKSVGAKTMQGPDYGLCTLTFENGAVAHVEATWMDPAGGRVTLEIAGSKGLFEYDSRKVPSLRTATPGNTALEANYTLEDDPFYRQMVAFIDCVQNKTPSPVPAKEAVMALRVAHAALESAQTGQVIEF